MAVTFFPDACNFTYKLQLLPVPVCLWQWESVAAVCAAGGHCTGSGTHSHRPASPTKFLPEKRVQKNHQREIVRRLSFSPFTQLMPPLMTYKLICKVHIKIFCTVTYTTLV